MTTPDRARILVVEDNVMIRKMHGLLLQRFFDVVLTRNFDEALEAATTQDFDVFLFDINLGESRDGIDLLGAVRQLPGRQAVPAIACTAYTTPNHREQFAAAGFDAFVGKPFTQRDLLEAIGALLNGLPQRELVPALVTPATLSYAA